MLGKYYDYLRILKSIILHSVYMKVLPKHIQIDVTTKCNLNCKMCFREKLVSPEKFNKDLKFVDYKHIINEIRPASVNMVTSGEAFLNPEVFDMIKYAAERNIQTIISSNFVLSKGIVDKIVDSDLDVLKISIDGATRETYKSVRGDHFDQIVSNVKYFNKKKDEKNKKTPGLRFDFVIQGDNYKEVIDYVSFANKLNAESIYYHPIDSREFTPEQVHDIIERVDLDELKVLLTEALGRAKKYGIHTNLKTLLKKYDLIQSLYRKNVAVKRKICIMPWMHIFVSITGETSPCCVIYPDKEKSYGNIFNQSMGDIWNGEKMKEDRKIFGELKNYQMYRPCRYCLPIDFYTLTEAVKTFPQYIKKVLSMKKRR